MDLTVIAYVVYLLISVALTIWVARTLSRNGRIFLADVLQGNEKLADAVNHLLVVGFYLVNLGFVALYLSQDDAVTDARAALRGAVGEARRRAARPRGDAPGQRLRAQQDPAAGCRWSGSRCRRSRRRAGPAPAGQGPWTAPAAGA